MESVIEWTPKAEAILTAASRLFYERGIHAVGVDLIAAEAGVTKKTLYDRFGSKERLVVEYLRRRDASWREHLAARLEAAPGEPRARLAAVFDASAEWMAQNSGKGCSMVNAHAEISDPAHPAYPVIVGQKAWMLDLFRGIVAQAALPDPDGIARTVMLLHEGALVADGMHTFPAPIRHARDAAVALLPGADKG